MFLAVQTARQAAAQSTWNAISRFRLLMPFTSAFPLPKLSEAGIATTVLPTSQDEHSAQHWVRAGTTPAPAALNSAAEHCSSLKSQATLPAFHSGTVNRRLKPHVIHLNRCIGTHPPTCLQDGIACTPQLPTPMPLPHPPAVSTRPLPSGPDKIERYNDSRIIFLSTAHAFQ